MGDRFKIAEIKIDIKDMREMMVHMVVRSLSTRQTELEGWAT